MTSSDCFLMAYFTQTLFHLPSGYIAMAKYLQTSMEVFFPLHLAEETLFLHITSLALPSDVFASLCEALQSDQPQRGDVLLPGFRCRICGLLRRSGRSMVEHFRECHDRKIAGDARGPNAFAPERVHRLATGFSQPRTVRGAAEWPGSLQELAVRDFRRQHDGGLPAGLHEFVQWLRFFKQLLELCGDFGVWRRGVEALLPARVWRVYKGLFAVCWVLILTGAWEGVRLDVQPGTQRAQRAPELQAPRELSASWKEEALRSRCLLDALSMADSLIRAACSARDLFEQILARYKTDLLNSHGRHVPKKVRDAATLLFWVPALKTSNVPEPEDLSLHTFDALVALKTFVAEAWPVCNWSGLSDAALCWQYCTLMKTWKHLAEQHGGCLDSFQGFWKVAHTIVDFKVPGCEAAFMLFHYTGSWGLSEAGAESAASMAKRMSSNTQLNLLQVCQRTLLRAAGLRGDGSDDLLLQRVWAEFFGSGIALRFTVKRRSHDGRLRRFKWGSKTISRQLDAATGKARAFRPVKKTQTVKRTQWRSILRQERVAFDKLR